MKGLFGFGVGLGLAWAIASLSACTGAMAYRNANSRTREDIDKRIDTSLGLMNEACRSI